MTHDYPVEGAIRVLQWLAICILFAMSMGICTAVLYPPAWPASVSSVVVNAGALVFNRAVIRRLRNRHRLGS